MACQAYPDVGLDTRSSIEYTYAWLTESILDVETNNLFDDFLFLCEKALYYTFSNNDVTFTPITSRFVDLPNDNKRQTNDHFPP